VKNEDEVELLVGEAEYWQSSVEDYLYPDRSRILSLILLGYLRYSFPKNSNPPNYTRFLLFLFAVKIYNP